MNNDEAREIVWDFQKHYLDQLAGAYYDKLREALNQLRDVSRLYDLDMERTAAGD